MAHPRIGQILLQAGVCTQQDLMQAWEQKVLFGDRLGTNLLALALIEEKTLALALGFQHQCAAAWGEVLKVQPDAVARLDRALCVERFVVPHHVEGDALYLLMRDPDDASTRKEISAVTALRVLPVVVPEARLWAVAQQVLGAPASLRPVPLDEAAAVARARRQAERITSEIPPPASPDLLSEDEFAALYMRQDATTEGAPVGPSVASEPGGPHEGPNGQALSGEGLPLTGDAMLAPPEGARAPRAAEASASPAPRPPGDVEAAAAPSASSPAQASAPADEAPLELTDALPPEAGDQTWPEQTLKGSPVDAVHAISLRDEHVLSVRTDEGEAVASTPLSAEDTPSATSSQSYRLELPSFGAWGPKASPFSARLTDAPAPAADPLPPHARAAPKHAFEADAFEPITFDEALPLLAEAHTRREIAQVVLRYAVSRFQRAALLTIYPGAIVGWCAAPQDFHEAVRRYRVERHARTVFSLVADSRAHYIGSLQTWRAHGAWVKQTGKVLPRSVAVLPIHVRGRVLNLLYGDNGHDAHVESDVGELLILGQRIAQSYEGLLEEAGVRAADASRA